MEIAFDRLAAAVSERLAPALPSGMTVVVTTADVAERLAVGGDDSRIAALLSDIADEASERMADRYEGDAAFEGAWLRLWFGLVPPGSGNAPLRDVLPELAPIPLAAITTS